jgi:hypothetical protein
MVVPVRAGSGVAALQCGQLPTGERVGIAFTSVDRLARVMGPGQAWIQIDVRAVQVMLAPVVVTRIQVDPGFVAVAGRPVAVSA